MDVKHLEIWLKLVRFMIVTVGFGIATIVVNCQFQQREVDIKEMEMLGKFVDHAIDGVVAKRQRFAEYFATVSRSKDVRNRWEKYKKKIDVQFQRIENEVQRIENEADELKKQKEQERKEAEALRKELAKTKILVKKKNTLAKSEIIKLQNEISQQQRKLNEVQAAAFEREDKLARVKAQLNEAKAEITYPTQRIQGQAPPKSGWVYLGEFDSSEYIWRKTNWNIDRKSEPKSLEGKTLRVSVDAVNVRNSGDPWAQVLDVMKLNSAIHVESIEEWEDTGYFWAKGTYY